MSSKRVAIIGCGASGLAAIKTCLDENLEPVCFEKTSDIGGLWNFRPQENDDVACCMRTTVINTSKEMSLYSDYPAPASSPNLMHHACILDYFNQYADTFGLRKYIQFNVEVKHIDKNSDYKETGRWKMTLRGAETTETSAVNSSTTEKVEIFDGVMLCTGHHAKPNMPHFEGEEKFEGKRLHTHNYREYPTEYAGQNVLVIGIGNSGLDVAVQLARIAKQVYLSTRTGAWICNLISNNGYPLDIMRSRRIVMYIRKILPGFTNWFEEFQVNSRFDHSLYGLKPKHSIGAQNPALSDDLPKCIMNGSVKIKPNVKKIGKSQVEFDDGIVVDNIDTIFYATGYTIGFPFLNQDILQVKNNKVNLYKYIFPPDLDYPTLAVIGCVQPRGALMPGDVKLPSGKEMQADIDAKAEDMSKRYYASQRHTIQVDYITYMDEIAEKVGCLPNLGRYLLTDPAFAMKLILGPCAPYQYRLQGHGSWTGARKAIETIWQRLETPLRTGKVPEDTNTGISYRIMAIALCLLILLFFWFGLTA